VFRRVMALTSVDPGALNGDLADRLLTVELERITETARASEEELRTRWDKAHAEVLGGLLHVTVDVLKALPTIQSTGLPRMADFARVLLAVDKVLGTDGYGTYTDQAGSTAQAVAEGDVVVLAIMDKIDLSFEGTATELLELLTDEHPPKGWPTTPQGMGGQLTRAAPTLRALGWTVERMPRKDPQGTKRWHISAPETDHDGSSSEWSEQSEARSPAWIPDATTPMTTAATDDLHRPSDDPADDPDGGEAAGQHATDDSDG